MRREVWEWWRKITAYPVLWLGAYLLWVGLGALLLFWYAALRPPGLAAGLLAVIAGLPFALLTLSNWTGRAYDRDGPR